MQWQITPAAIEVNIVPKTSTVITWYIVIDLSFCQLYVPFPFIKFCLELNCECVLFVLSPVA